METIMASLRQGILIWRCNSSFYRPLTGWSRSILSSSSSPLLSPSCTSSNRCSSTCLQRPVFYHNRSSYDRLKCESYRSDNHMKTVFLELGGRTKFSNCSAIRNETSAKKHMCSKSFDNDICRLSSTLSITSDSLTATVRRHFNEHAIFNKHVAINLNKRSPVLACHPRHFSTKSETLMNVFDRKAKRLQKNNAALNSESQVYDYIKNEIGWRVSDRICDVKRKFPVAVDLGCGKGYVSKHVFADTVGTIYQCDMAEKMLSQSDMSEEVPTFRVHMDEEVLPFKHNCLDLVVSSLSLHWVNDLPGCFRQIHNCLKNDGCLIGSMFGGDTLFELRSSLHMAEIEREGGVAAHISPFTTVQDLGNLLNRAGFTMLTIDIDEMVVGFPSMFELMHDLKGMGESNCAHNRRLHLPRETQRLAAQHYKKMYGNDDEEGIPATFQIIYFIGWKPDPSQSLEVVYRCRETKLQAKAAKRGSGQVSLKDIDKIDSLSAELEEKRRTGDVDARADDLAKQIDKLREVAARDINDHGNKN